MSEYVQVFFADQLLCFQNIDGVRTQNKSVAQKWLLDKKEVVAYICESAYSEPIVTAPIKSILTTEEFGFVFITDDHEKYYVKKKFPKVRYITPDFFSFQEGNGAICVKTLTEAKKLIDKGKKPIAVYHEDAQTLVKTACVKKISFDENMFETDTGVKYYVQ